MLLLAKMTTISNHSNLISPQQQQQHQQNQSPHSSPLSNSGLLSPLVSVNSTSNVSTTSSSGSNNVNNRHSDNLALWSHISVNLLHNWIIDDVNSPNNKLLIIDSRDPIDYHTLHIRHAINLFDSAVMRKQLVSDKMSINELLVKYSNIDLINTNLKELNFVVYDHKSEHTNQLEYENEFSVILLRKLVQKYTTNVSFLSGGFKQFHEQYADLCESTSSMIHTTSVSTMFHESATGDLLNMTTNRQQASHHHHQLLTRNDSESKDTFGTEPIGPKKPRQLKLSHSLSTYAFDGLTASSGASSLSSPTLHDVYEQNHSLSSPFNPNPLLLITNKSNSSLSSLGSGGGSTAGGASNTGPKIRQPTKILSYLYLGSEEDASCKLTMDTLGITNVLNVSVNCQKPDFIGEQNFLRIPVNDGPFDKILPYFDQAFNFIENCRKANKKVIIHCLAGISRSPTLAIAYLMKHKNIRSDEAYKFVKERRHTISPSFNFLGQLFEYEKQQAAASTAASNTFNKIESILEPCYGLVNTKDLVTTTSSSQTAAPPPPALNFLMTKKPSFTNQFQLRSPQPSTPVIQVSTCASASRSPLPNSTASSISQRKKQFVFEFNNVTSSTASSNNNSNILIQSPIKSLQLNSPLVLHSPCQALSTFHINSPCTENPPSAAMQPHQLMLGPKPMCKSFTLDSITTSNGTATTPTSSNVILRRPTNLLLTTTNVSKSIIPSNNLKRPSSILLTGNVSLNKQVITEETATSTATAASKDFNLKSDSTTSQSFFFTRSLSNNSSCSSGSASSTSSCSSSTNTTTATVTSATVQQTHTNPQSSQKKLKLSPIQDNFYKNLFPGAENGILTRSLFDNDDDDEMVDTSQNMASNNHSKPTTPLTPTSVLNTDNLVTCFNQKLNESKSIENIKLTACSANLSDDSSNTENISENFGAFAKQQSKITNSSSLNSINMANSGNGNNNSQQKSSSNSSSKPGSNKNSLHGSVETMIQVS